MDDTFIRGELNLTIISCYDTSKYNNTTQTLKTVTPNILCAGQRRQKTKFKAFKNTEKVPTATSDSEGWIDGWHDRCQDNKEQPIEIPEGRRIAQPKKVFDHRFGDGWHDHTRDGLMIASMTDRHSCNLAVAA